MSRPFKCHNCGHGKYTALQNPFDKIKGPAQGLLPVLYYFCERCTAIICMDIDLFLEAEPGVDSDFISLYPEEKVNPDLVLISMEMLRRQFPDVRHAVTTEGYQSGIPTYIAGPEFSTKTVAHACKHCGGMVPGKPLSHQGHMQEIRLNCARCGNVIYQADLD